MEKAAALRYTLEMPAPLIVATGRGELARRMKEIAREHDIRLVSDPDLAESLVELDAGSLIPEELYTIVAELLVFVHSRAVRGLETAKGRS